jgi:hypothetical protein
MYKIKMFMYTQEIAMETDAVICLLFLYLIDIYSRQHSCSYY